MTNIEQEGEIEQEVKPEGQTKRKKLTVSERMRIIDDFRNGIPDKYYSVNPNPRKPGEYILRKRKSPLTYDIERPTHKRNESISCLSASESITNSTTENTNETTKTPSQLLTEPKKSFVGTGTALNPLAGTEFFSMQSSLNANLQRELDALHEKFNKLDAKFRKERAARKSVRKQQQEQQQEQEENEHYMPGKFKEFDEYEYEYADEPQNPPVEDTPPMNPLFQRRPRINIRDY